MKKTALHAIHLELGAKMVPFAGFEMPVSYKGLNAEHQHVREHVGVFDVSHMGEFFVRGEKAMDLLQYVCSNDISKLVDGQAQYNCFPSEEGGIVDDLIVYRLNGEEFMLVVNASNIDKDWAHLQQYNRDFGADLTNRSDEMSLLAIQGPKATAALQPLTELKLDEIPFYHLAHAEFDGVGRVLVSATGYTGSGGFELYCENDQAPVLWKKVFEIGAAQGIEPIGLGARDTLRTEMGYCLYGNDIDDSTSPIEAGLGWITKFNKEFVNKQALLREKEEGTAQRLVGFAMKGKGIPRNGYRILNEEGEEIGRVTSGTQSPSLGYGIGLGYIQRGYTKSGTPIAIEVRKSAIPAETVKLPFYKN